MLKTEPLLPTQLEFFNVDEFETMATGEHFMATDVEWDPTGRYIATSVTHVHQVLHSNRSLVGASRQPDLMHRVAKTFLLVH